jgi:hypothetical protein
MATRGDAEVDHAQARLARTAQAASVGNTIVEAERFDMGLLVALRTAGINRLVRKSEKAASGFTELSRNRGLIDTYRQTPDCPET